MKFADDLKKTVCEICCEVGFLDDRRGFRLSRYPINYPGTFSIIDSQPSHMFSHITESGYRICQEEKTIGVIHLLLDRFSISSHRLGFSSSFPQSSPALRLSHHLLNRFSISSHKVRVLFRSPSIFS